jgi:sulfhydrogenase subunit beta (sulfur reductase)
MKYATQKDLNSWLDGLAERATLFAPRDVEGIILYEPVSGSQEIVFDYTRPKMSAKDFILPATETLLTIERREGEIAFSEPELAREQIVFGARPCDAMGYAAFDAMFLETEPVDQSYARRREKTTLIGMACPQMWDECFCTSVGGAPDDATHVDILLTKMPDGKGYAVKGVTEKGQKLLADLKMSDKKGDPPAPTLHAETTPVLPQKDWPALFEDEYWQEIAERCLSCRICAYVCPTCRCFDVRDELGERRAGYSRCERLRCWDSCTGSNYRTVAGGHNPRALKAQRLRNRFFCRFLYFAEAYGPLGCVGCGRCVEACPVNIDIVEMLQNVDRIAGEVQT